ncbi:MAG: Sugar isomerase (SIS) [Desulfonauticus sp. 38_4375]|nr:MAG: Sugar isomerase (SIS) [Desulfonauticus sp. 38_4375]
MYEFVSGYIQRLVKLLESIELQNICDIINLLDNIDPFVNTIYFIGNGGSAATASHFANDIGIGLKIRGIKNINVVCLTDNIPVITSISNDIGYENIFYAQLKDKIKKGDLLFAISASGNSANILKAAKYAKSVGALVIGCTGFDGGELKKLSDISFHVSTEKGEYGIVEDIHMILDHLIFSYFISTKEGASTKYVLE